MSYIRSRGFTVVELLVVIVVIAILAAVTIVAFNGVQQRARDSQRASDITAIAKALEMYYLDNGSYPLASGSTAINSGWSTTADASWSNLRSLLAPYVPSIPADPISTPGANIVQSSTPGFNYAYFSNSAGAYCGTGANQMYLLIYRLEASPQVNTLRGNCTGTPVGPYSGASNYRQVNK